MLSIDIVCVGKLSQPFFREGCEEYIKRLSPFAKITVSELSETKLTSEGAAAEKRVIEEESARIEAHIAKKKALVVAMCVEGKKLSSTGLAEYIERAKNETSAIAFVIGGSLGLSEEFKRRADLRLSVSDMTFPHQLFRLMLLEQLYRAETINNNIKYHK
ncbi:MAG: 23S rRNA (pseudouridine(1915)-N(3))-methyltransferase RlmH [Ruminococcaceae bacterium]|nr:23S rRNA (pseudouridine(1915)-N(3))-methyltransferase RlmH [Oscillospiraceae bacterium]